ncbi:MAG: hypothetical protein CMM93_08670 [Rickettsiales bacterium]|nr:hypothetical protein [Rickettsiales bacterium]
MGLNKLDKKGLDNFRPKPSFLLFILLAQLLCSCGAKIKTTKRTRERVKTVSTLSQESRVAFREETSTSLYKLETATIVTTRLDFTGDVADPAKDAEVEKVNTPTGTKYILRNFKNISLSDSQQDSTQKDSTALQEDNSLQLDAQDKSEGSTSIDSDKSARESNSNALRTSPWLFVLLAVALVLFWFFGLPKLKQRNKP